MNIFEAYDILYRHQEWRIGVALAKPVEPGELSKAIAVVLKFVYSHLQAEHCKFLEDES